MKMYLKWVRHLVSTVLVAYTCLHLTSGRRFVRGLYESLNDVTFTSRKLRGRNIEK